VLRLLTFGGLSLEVNGQLVTGAMTQRRRMALLVLLAAARDRGVARDRMLALLWPESDDARARHVLAQLLYAEQRDTQSDELFLGTKTLRLNPAVMTSDLAQFEDALAAGDPAAALGHYFGPFLDGFHVDGAPEFEEWLDRQRRRYADQARQAAEGLARQAAASDDAGTAVGWWHRAIEIAPHAAPLALALADTLRSVGDRSGALAALTGYADRLRRDLDLEPEPEVARALASLRGGPG
jgi:serine/threonine-protein kinase